MKAVGEHFNSSYLKDYLSTIAELNVVRLQVLQESPAPMSSYLLQQSGGTTLTLLPVKC